MMAEATNFIEMGPPAQGLDEKTGKGGLPGTSNGDAPDVIIFNDGQSYQIKMNYLYTTGDAIRGYQSLQKSDWSGWTLYSRPYASGDFSKVIISNPSLPYYYKPDYWSYSPMDKPWLVAWGYNQKWEPGIPSQIREKDRVELSSTDSIGSYIFQDSYADRNGYIITPNTNYQLTFYAKGTPTKARATVDWWVVGESTYRIRYIIPVDSTNWKFYTTPPSMVSPTFNVGQHAYAKITFTADAGGYAYISTTDFGIPGGVT